MYSSRMTDLQQIFYPTLSRKWEVRNVPYLSLAPSTTLEWIKKVVLKFHGGRQRTFNLATLKKQGVSIKEIETMLTRTFDEQNDQIRDVDFVVDVVAVANLVQPETNKILHGLK